jgi:hypothetical protein
MGYYFPKAETKEALNPKQLERYRSLRSIGGERPPALNSRLEAIVKRIGSITSGEIWPALEELVQDAFVAWVLADEDPAKVEWLDHYTEEKEPTEEERQRSKEWWGSFQREFKEREERQKREYDEWEKADRPIFHFFRRTLSYFWRSK